MPPSRSPCSCSGCNSAQPRRSAPGIEAAVRSGLREHAAGPAASKSSHQDPLTVIDVGHTPDGIRQSLASLKAIHGAERLDSRDRRAPGDKKAGEIVGACWRRRSTRSSARQRITRARPPASYRARSSARQPADHLKSPPRSRTQCVRPSATGGVAQSENYMWRADCSWRSNTRNGRPEAAARQDLEVTWPRLEVRRLVNRSLA